MKKDAKTFSVHRLRRGIFITSGAIAISCTIGVTGYNISKNIGQVNAQANQLVAEKITGDYIPEKIPDLDFQVEMGDPIRRYISAQGDTINATSLPTSYDSRTHGYISRQEDQAGEGLCWAYSFTTTAESYLLKKGLVSSAVELSPKQLDYALAPASEALSDSSTNKYEDFTYSVMGKHRSLTGGGNFLSALAVTSGKYSLTGDDAFFSKMKLNDPETLEGFSSYGDFITNRYELAHADPNAKDPTYTTKQKSADVFDKASANYAVTGADFIDLGYYESGSISEKRQNAISKIKNDIMNYGAVAIASHYNEEKCMYKDGDNYTIIDRTSNDYTSTCDDSITDPSDHGMTLVGWDDNWSYRDNNSDKTGAFILQNSYGNDNINYYFSYNSSALATSITDMQSTKSFTNIFDVSDFTKTVNADDYEVTFDFTANGVQNLSEIATFINPISNNSMLSWDIYVSSNNGQYEKVGKINDDVVLGLHNIKNINKSIKNNFSIKIKYNSAGYTIRDLTPEVFSEQVAPYMVAVAYMDSSSSNPTPAPTPNSDPSGDPAHNPNDPINNNTEGNIPVPSTAASASKASFAPDTGGNTSNQETDLATFGCLLPIFAVIVTLGHSVYKRKKQIRFEH